MNSLIYKCFDYLFSMKLMHSDFKKGPAKIKVENLDDLWYLNQIIETHDLIKGKTLRKIKIGQEDQRKQKVTKKSIFLLVEVEKIEFGKTSNVLRVSGTVKEGTEDIPLGSYHTFNIEENTIITIIKQNWLKFQIDKLKEASKEASSRILICVHDREEAYFALMKKYGYQLLSNIKGTVQKKQIYKK